NKGDKEKQFHFTVTLKDKEGNELTGSYDYSGSKEGTLKSGESVALKNGESVTIHNIPENTRYSVVEEEANKNGYTTSSKGEEGTIKANGNEMSIFTNDRSVNVPPGNPNQPNEPREPEPPREDEPTEPTEPKPPKDDEPNEPNEPEPPKDDEPNEPNEPEPPKDDEPNEPNEPEPPKNDEPILPQTGTPWVTIMLLASSGVVLMIGGSAKNRKKK
ncbi:MAG: hypothetical protein HFE62_01335, partial [Firmicutes bacterium]|nr:hypothetical protein [Bacillota bacterium]